jgi:hypothetical protein
MTAAQTTQLTKEDNFRQKLKLKSFNLKNSLEEKHPHAVDFFRTKGVKLLDLRERSAKLLSAGALTGALLFSPPESVHLLPTPQELIKQSDDVTKKVNDLIPEIIHKIIPEVPRPLSRNEEKFLEQIFSEVSGIRVKAALEGEHLISIYGLIGLEQHLKRYPGDTLSNHGQGQVLGAGIAPGLGAWGYFSPSEEKLTESLEETERWYAVVQTLYLPDWSKRHSYLRDWYKYRKVLIVNTVNSKAVVAAISDSGPAAWTGKQFGGSPEVMSYLGGDKFRKGPVLVFFVDDPDNKVPLGPINYKIGLSI